MCTDWIAKFQLFHEQKVYIPVNFCCGGKKFIDFISNWSKVLFDDQLPRLF